MTRPMSRSIALLTFFLLFSVPGWATKHSRITGESCGSRWASRGKRVCHYQQPRHLITTRSYDRRLR